MDTPKTIVEYTATEPAYNGYPERIVSPPLASACCCEEMMAVGGVHRDDDMPFVYRQCRLCGHTVRHFLEDGFSGYEVG